MNRRFVLIFASVGLAMSLLLTLFFLMTGAVPVQAAPARDVRPAPDAAPMRQTTVTPSYTISDSVTGGVVYDWIEIAGNGGVRVPLSGDNSGSGEVDVGFYFPFYDNVYRTFRVSTNGYVYFGQNAEDGRAYGGNTPIFVGSGTDPNDFIAPFGADLYVHPDVSRIYVRRDPGRTVIEFVDVQWCCGLNTPHTFQVILYPDGRILTQYRQVRYLTNPDRRVVAGIENADGSDGAAYFQGYFQADDSLDNDLAVLYDPGDTIFGHLILDPPQQSLWDDPGYPINTNATLFNLSGITDVFSLTYSLQVSSSVVPTASLWPVDVPDSAAVTGTGTLVFPYPIANLDEATFAISATIPITAGWWDRATLAITASARTSPTISTTLVITYGVAHRDLSIEKVLAPDQPRPAPGGYFRYRLDVTNGVISGSNRYGWARDVQVTDRLPDEAVLEDLDADTGDSGTLLLPGFYWNVGDMAPGDTESLYAYMWLPGTVPTDTVLTNTCGVTMLDSIEYGPFDNNTAVHTTTLVSPEIDLDVTKLFVGPLGPDIVGAGHVATYTVGVANRGNVAVTGTIVTDVIPQGTTFYTTTWPTFTQMADGRTLVFTIGTVLNGDWNAHIFQVAVSVPLTTPLGTWLTNTVHVTTTAPLDQFVQAQGDEDEVAIQVIDPRGDAAVYKMPASLGGTPVTPEPGGDYTFWISYTNWGNLTVYTVTLTDTLPISHVVLLEAGPAGLAQPDTSMLGVVRWTIDELAPGAVGWTRVRIGIDEDAPLGTQLVNTAHIAAAEGLNITTTNDVSIVTVTLDATDVTIGKAVTPAGTLRVHDLVTYTVRFTNTGVLTADGVRIVDDLPPGLTDVSWMTNTGGCAVELLEASPTRLRWRTTKAMQAGDWGEIVIAARLDSDATWPAQPLLINQATIETTTRERPDPDNDPNEAQASNPVMLASPYVVKTGPTLAQAGERVTYTIEYGNGGLLPAEGVYLTDTLPVSTTYVTDTSGFTVTTDTTWVAWDVGTLLSDTAGLTFTLVVSVSPDIIPGAALENRIELTSSTYDGDRTDNESVWLTPVGFDLSSSHKLVNGQDSARVDPGTPVTYTIVLENAGSSDATAVSLTDPIPDHTTYVPGTVSAMGGASGYDPDSNAITWTGTVSGNAQVTVTFHVTVGQGLARDTVIANTAYVSDSVQTFEASALATVTGPDLSGSYKTVDEAQPNTGDRIIYTIVLSNSGEIDAVGASLVDGLPLSYVAYGGDGWASSGSLGGGDPITWTGTVTRGRRVTITLPVTVTAGPSNRFENTVSIDDGTAADAIERSVAVQTVRPILAVQKSVSADELASGERVTYTIAITNSGGGWAYSALLTDTIEGGTFAPGDAAASSGALDDSAPPTLTWTGEITPNGGSIYITIPVTITAAPDTDVANTVYVDDGYGNVVSDTTSLHVYSDPDLSASSKVVDRDAARAGETLVYTLTVVNIGELPTSFFVTDTLDADTVFTGFLGSPADSYGHAAGVITWTGTVAALDREQLAFEAVISASISGRVTNTARFGGDGMVYTGTASTDIIVPAALTATKTVNPVGPVVAGGELTYTIVVQNVGGDAAQAFFTDTVPLHMNFLAVQTSKDPPATYDQTSDQITWSPVELVAGETATITFRVQVAPGTLTGTEITNVAELRELKEPGEPFSVTTTSANTVVAPVFTVTKQAEPVDAVWSGQRITYTVAITNVDGGVARVAVTDTLPVSTTCDPSSLAVDPSTLASPECASGTLTWLDNVNAESVVRLTYAVVVSEATPIGAVLENNALLQELSQPDVPVTVSTTHTVLGPELNGVKRATPRGDVAAGGLLTYTIVVSNSGGAPAWVELSDLIPTHTTYVSDSAQISNGLSPTPVYDSDDGRITWQGDVAAYRAVTLTFQAQVAPGAQAGALITNVAALQEQNEPGEPFSVTVTNTVVAPALHVAKDVEPAGEILAGDRLTYTIVVSNSGSGTARVELSDPIPAHTGYVSASVAPPTHAPPTYDPITPTVGWVGDVAPGAWVTLTLVVTADLDAPNGVAVTNEVWVRELSTQAGPFTRSVSNTILAPALRVHKAADPAGDVLSGAYLNYDVVIANDGGATVTVYFSDTIPAETALVTRSVSIEPDASPPTYTDGALTWQGAVGPGKAVTVSFRAQVDPGAISGTLVSNLAWIQEVGGAARIYTDTVTNTVVAPALEAVKQSLPAGAVRPGEMITYLISLNSPESGVVRATVTDTMPTHTHYISGSAQAKMGLGMRHAGITGATDLENPPDPVYDADNDRLTWTGDVLSGRSVTLTFRVTVSLEVSEGAIITNTAWIKELSNPTVILERRATNPIVTQFDIYLPLVLRNS